MMQTFKEYSDGFVLSYNADSLDYALENGVYCIYEGSEHLKTTDGNLFSDSSEEFIRQLLTDLLLSGGDRPSVFSFPFLYSFGADVLDKGHDPFPENLDEIMVADPFVSLKTSGRSGLHPFSPEEHFFTFSYVTLSGLIESINRFSGNIMGEIGIDENEKNPFQKILKVCYEQLTINQKVVIQALSGIHGSGIVMPLLLVSGYIGPAEYSKGLISLKLQSSGKASECFSEAACAMAFTGQSEKKEFRGANIRDLIAGGESDSLEFKSTLRWDIRAGKTNPAIERACLKTISAFLNSSGGTLLIGVRDDGSIEGIETDKFPNEDKFLLHLWILIRTCLGRDFALFIQTRLETLDGKAVCKVRCLPSDRPVFLRQPGYPEEMYIRLGPSSNALDISEALKYIENHFQGKPVV